MIDHSVLRPESTEQDVKQACSLATKLGVAAVVVNPAHIPVAAASLRGSNVKPCSVIAFPFGLSTTEAKLAETTNALAQGAMELDVVMNFSALRSDREDYVLNETRSITELAKSRGSRVIVKVILETCYLSESQKKQACLLAVKGGADFVKTSTGFGSGGATVEDVRLMKQTVGPRVGVKAAGGIRTVEQAFQMIDAGADRIGTSSTVSILKALPS
jgi:deoxyribose-phosphate aldolase